MSAGDCTTSQLFYGRLRAAKLVDLSYKTLDNAIRNGEIEARKVGRRVLISHDELLRFVESHARVVACPGDREAE
jgi:excisionase family DNA binding protein